MIGGAEIAVKEITDRISDIEFDMVTLRFNRNHLYQEKVGNVNVYRIGGGLGYLSKILFIPHAVFFALKRNYDLYWSIMTYMLFPVVFLHLLGKKVPYVLTLQDGDPFTHVFTRFRIFLFKPMLSYGFRHVNRVQTISNFLAKWAKQMKYKGEVEVIPNGVDIDRFKIPNFAETTMGKQDSEFKNKNETILITTSRLVKKNGVGDVIEAVKFLPENVKFRILGSGSLESDLKHQSRILNLESRIMFLGHIPYDEIPRHLHKAGIFIRPSLSEGMGSSFIEAMAAGLPIIGTPVGGIVDFLKDGETGIFCEVNNPESIVKAVKRIMEDAGLHKKLIENGQKLVKEKYDWKLIVNEIKTRIFDPAMT